MNICIWQSYGNISVFRTETNEEISKLIDRIEIVVSSWGMGLDDSIQRLREVLLTNPISIRPAIVRFARLVADTNSFERLEFSTVQEL